MPPPARIHRGLLAALLAAACGGEPDAPSAAPIRTVRAAEQARGSARAPELPPQLPRSSDERLSRAAHALGRGDLALANRLLLSTGEEQGLDRTLLRARLFALEGDAVAAVREIEEARRGFPGEGRVYATAAEIHAAAGRLKSAEDEIREGLAVAGPTPEIARARGVLALCREGGARVGLDHLLDARGRDPGIWFTERPLAQAHLLLGNRALADGQALEAAGHARAGRASDPSDRELLRLEADALAAAGDFDGAEGLYEELHASGEGLATTLSIFLQRAATAALVANARDVAVRRYLRARELGLSDGELGFGASVLREEAGRALDEGLDRYDAGDLEAALERFERALELAPGSIEAANHAGVARFKLGDYAGAEKAWRAVLELAGETGAELPEPVHLNLARALFLQDRAGEIRPLLLGYLEREPGGEWAGETREMLARLPADTD